MAEPRRVPEPPAEHQLYAELQTMAAVVAAHLPPPGWVYASPYDFILQHGAFYTPTPRPAGYYQGAPKCCFGNAIVAAVLHADRYVEGWALLSVGGEPGIGLEHAWVTPGDGVAYEVTTDAPWLAYWGIEFSVERADNCTWEGDATVLNDYCRRHPLLQQRWTGETWHRVWPYSPRLAALRRERRARRRRPASAAGGIEGRSRGSP